MQIKIRKVYFSCALTGLPESHREAMKDLRGIFKKHYHVIEFLNPTDPPHVIYHHDIHHAVKKSHFLISVCDERSTGLGWEMGTAIEKHGKPVIALAHVDSYVSPLICGVDHPRFELVRYSDLEDIERLVLDFEKRHFSLQGRIKDFMNTIKWHIRKTPNA